MLSYSHLSLHNSVFEQFAPRLKGQAKIKTLLTASPLSMGLLTGNPPPWHPAPTALKEAIRVAKADWDGDFINLALGYALGRTGTAHDNIPLVTGFSTPKEVHECVTAWREIKQGGAANATRKAGEEKAKKVIRDAGYLDWSWASP